MSPRINIVDLAPTAYTHMAGVERWLASSQLPATTLHLVKLRVSQINGCGFCVDMHSHEARGDAETDERLFSVAAWREAPYFTAAERATLALAEEATRLADRDGQAVPAEVWDEAAHHYDEETLAALVIAIAQINAWNRIGVTTRQVAGSHRR
ncbi:carboxymuconolactone decarboxylase family protein [Lipingzhangella sp. LS1_29]|uniref:Carboxymuconolactone decarboxylase family protein n=1 Tax=Lipingzhangella rawalii TaxID=2055835 RepID=A0ABU2H396_9ACTN|nr:carboxymuconolactone decarboxylase family protein [Lipingzhangella rawalii]MDS1269773.1 carboxymuconolactone decarboxylase family protein [Lipingzhangella rawalii]